MENEREGERGEVERMVKGKWGWGGRVRDRETRIERVCVY